MSFKQYAASELPANLPDAEAEARHGRVQLLQRRALSLRKGADGRARRRYAAYKRSHTQLQHRDYFATRKDEEWMRQQFDPRRLEEAAKQRTEAAVQAAAEFSLAAALEPQPSAPDAADAPVVRLAAAATARRHHPRNALTGFCASDCGAGETLGARRGASTHAVCSFEQRKGA